MLHYFNKGKNATETSGQDGGVGRHTSPPCATIKELQPDLKIIKTQNR